jgi:peptidyl-prolyl cis-trans isomerase B (cyclophilin B)|tara:strand:- start:17790 stop:18626 length:837 start_codon:yes stop_codon:yes gene_type:complete
MKPTITHVSAILLIALLLACNDIKESSKVSEKERTQVEMVTNYGTMQIELYDETPLHRDNFLNLAKNKAYDSLLFHRVINTFMIQAGDPDSKKATSTDTLGDGDAPYLVQAEFNDSLFHKKGVLAAARDNNPERASSAMQFYIVQGKVFNDSLLNLAEERINKMKAARYFEMKPIKIALLDSLENAMSMGDFEKYNDFGNRIWEMAKVEKDFAPYTIPAYQRDVYKTIGGTPHLDQNYTVYGEVISGLEVIDSIAKAPTSPLDRPLKDVRILEVNVIE